METLVVCYFSVINVSLGWLSVETESDKKKNNPGTFTHMWQGTDGNRRREVHKKKKVRGKSRGEEKETVGVRRTEDHLQISSILERRRRG